ncbi:MAG: RHS repeat-associated core domain-containing protein, partial [Opitutales bacterium]|nr:RHS repeat-associated core domain-containing protein [Opitutales bacterium]
MFLWAWFCLIRFERIPVSRQRIRPSHLLASVTGPVHTVTNSYESGRDAMTSKTNAAASGTVSRLSARYDALGLSVLRTELSSGDGMEMIGEETDDNPLAPQAGLLQDASGSHGPMSTPLESPLQSPLLPSTSLTERELLSEGSKRLEFKYDYIGRRVSKQVWTHTGGSWTDESTTAFVYDGWNLIEEVSTSSQTASINHYTWGLDLSGSLQGAGGVGGLLSVVCAPFTESGLIGDWLLPIGYVPLALSGVEGPAPSTFHYTFDLNGNVSELLDATGSIAAHYEYGPFGELTHEFISSNSHLSLLTFNFSTKYHDSETGLLYYGYRYYDPSTGRWLNRDPIEESGGLNLYGFVGNDAVNRWDLLGMAWTIDRIKDLLEECICKYDVLEAKELKIVIDLLPIRMFDKAFKQYLT